MKLRNIRPALKPAKLLAMLRGPLSYLMTLLLIWSCCMMSYSVASPVSAPVNQGGGSGNGNGNGNGTGSTFALDLSNGSPTVTPGSAVGSGVNVNVNGSSQTVVSNVAVSPAVYMAAMQVLATGRQSINIGAANTATSGIFNLQNVQGTISGLTVPAGVTGYNDFHLGGMNLTGNFLNAGTFYAISSSTQTATATINASNIINTGTLTSRLPSGIPEISGISNLNFVLKAVNAITNNGVISSAGSLNLQAGTTITNETLAGNGATQAAIQATSGLVMQAPAIVNTAGYVTSTFNNVQIITDSLTNSGLMQALAGTMSIQSDSGRTLSIVNTGGTLGAAAAMDISVSNAFGTNLSVIGGVLMTPALSLSARNGAITVNVDDIGDSSGALVDLTTRYFNLAINNGSHGLTLTTNQNAGALSYQGIGNVVIPNLDTNGGSVIINTTGSINVNGTGNIDTTSTTGNAGSVSLQGGTTVTVGDITATGGTTGSGGTITIIGGGDVNAGNLNSSGGSQSGQAGAIYVEAGTSGTGNATTHSLTADGASGGANVTVLAPGTVNVNGDVSTSGGNLTLGGTSQDVSGGVSTGTGSVTVSPHADENGDYVVNFSKLLKFSNGRNSITVGDMNGFAGDIVLNVDCNQCLGLINSLVFATAGHYNATGTKLTLPSATDFQVNANGGINTGSVVGGHSVSFSTKGALMVDGDVITSGGVRLAGDTAGAGAGLTVAAGKTVSGTSVSMSTGKGSLNSAGQIASTQGNVDLNSGGALNILDNASISAAANLAITAQGALSIGASGQGVSLKAGSVNGQGFSGSNVAQEGSVIIDNYLNGTGQASIIIGSNVSITTAGAGTSGEIGIHSGSDLSVGAGSNLQSYGGNVWLNATNDVNVGSGTSVSAYANTGSSGGGGGVAVLAGSPQVNLSSLLASMAASKTSQNQISVPTGSTFLADNTINATNGSVLQVVFPTNSTKTISANTFNLNGGVLYIDPPGSQNVNISGATFNSVGPAGSTGGTTAGSTAGTTAGSTLGTTAGTTAGSTLGTTAGTTAGSTLGTTAGTTAGSTLGTTSGTTAGTTLGSGSTAGTTAGSTLGTTAGTTSGSTLGTTTGSTGGTLGSTGGTIAGTIGATLGSTSGTTSNSTTSGFEPLTFSSSNAGQTSSTNSLASQAGSSTATQRDVIAGANSSAVTSNTSNTSSSVAPSDSTKTEASNHSGLSAAIYCSPASTLKPNESLDDDNSWIIATNKCQPFSFETADGSIVIGSGPAIFTPSINRTLLLKEGKLMIVAGEGIVIVRTPICNLTIPINSAATVEYKPDGKFGGTARLTNLAGGKASVSITRQDETMILSAAAGEQVVIAENSPEIEIRCEPNVANKKVQSWLVQVAGFRAEKFQFDRSEMLAREDLLNCTLGCFTKLQQGMIEQIRKSMTDLSPTQLRSLRPVKAKTLISTSAGASKEHLQSVGFGQVIDLTVPAISTLNCQSASVKYTASALVSIESPTTLNLRKGDALISTTKQTTVNAGRYSIQLQPNAIVLVSNRDDHVIVRTIFEASKGSATIVTPEKRALGVMIGQEVIVGRDGISYTRVLGEDAIGRRRMRHLALGSNTNVISSEVSLVSLIHNTDILSQISRSTAPEDKTILAKVMKMAVVLSMVTQRHGNFSMLGQ